MQCKDIPDLPILQLLTTRPDGLKDFSWFNIFSKDHDNVRSIYHGMPEGVGYNLARAKMANLIKRGLVDGCTCGCRGDFYITQKGINFLSAQTTKEF